MIVARAPLRISFGGGGTDLPAYYERHGGLVLSTTIQASCHVRVMAHAGSTLVVHSHDYQRSIAMSPDEPVTIAEPLSLPRAVAAWFAARRHRLTGLQAWLRADVPPGSGLGSSSAMIVALVAAFGRASGLVVTRHEIAEIACEIEIDCLGRPIGRQDQYAAALGGLNVMTFSRRGVELTPQPIAPAVARSLEAHLLLVSTGQTRDSASVLRPQRDASSSDGAVVERLDRIKALAGSMSDALTAGDLPRFGALLDESWQLKRGLAQGVTSPRIDGWYALARRHGAYGGKIAGAGGGGHFIFCVPPHRRAAVTAALVQEGLTPLPLTLDRGGCMVHGELVGSPPWSQRTAKGSNP
jgi:D-glycero-alpha-D-manno-heptose-7-phosphate kinase